jgi:aminoglycoside phosphotransferase (APT) family kinase protein
VLDPPADLPYDPMGRAAPAKRAAHARQRLTALARGEIWEPDPAVEELLGRATGAPAPDGSVISHGDLHVRHLLVDGAGRAAGVIDWGDLCRADPAVDLSLAYGAFSGRAREALLDAYGPVSDASRTAARVLAVSLCAALAEYAAGTAGRGRLLAESLRGLHRAAS